VTITANVDMRSSALGLENVLRKAVLARRVARPGVVCRYVY
jgi:hypothetical protein